MFIVKYKKIFFAIALVMMIASVVIMAIKGFNVGIDFTGGSVLEVQYQSSRPSLEYVQETIKSIVPESTVQESGDDSFVIRSAVIDQATKDSIITSLGGADVELVEKRFNTVGPSIGKQLRTKAITSLIIVVVAVILFIAFSFRKVSQPVSSWVYGTVAVTVLIHDVIIPAGIFALLGIQIDTLFIVGLLTILGVSINDTIVVFDRIRENLESNQTNHVHESFESVVGKSVTQTFARSLMTSVTVLLALGALWIWGPTTTHNLAMIMFFGMFFGTYSSIFLASPLLVVWNDYKMKRMVK